MNKVCIYHKVDFDGIGSASIVNLKFNGEVDFIPYNYGDDIDIKALRNRIVYIVDCSLPVEDMITLKRNSKLIWIDHHKTALEKMDGCFIDGKQEIGKAGCELTWEFLYPDKEMPEAIRLLGRYDVWDLTDDKVEAFQFGLRTEEKYQDPTFIGWEDHITSHYWDWVNLVVKTGRDIIKYRDNCAKSACDKCGFTIEWEGLTFAGVNTPLNNSSSVAHYDPAVHDAMMVFSMTSNGEWTFSLYSDKPTIDVSPIAVKYGGGGHVGACGFMLDDLPFDLKGEKE